MDLITENQSQLVPDSVEKSLNHSFLSLSMWILCINLLYLMQTDVSLLLKNRLLKYSTTLPVSITNR